MDPNQSPQQNQQPEQNPVSPALVQPQIAGINQSVLPPQQVLEPSTQPVVSPPPQVIDHQMPAQPIVNNPQVVMPTIQPPQGLGVPEQVQAVQQAGKVQASPSAAPSVAPAQPIQATPDNGAAFVSQPPVNEAMPSVAAQPQQDQNINADTLTQSTISPQSLVQNTATQQTLVTPQSLVQNTATQQTLVTPQVQQLVNTRTPSKKLSLIMSFVFIVLSFGMLGFGWRVLQVRKHNSKKVAAIFKPATLAKEEQKKVGDGVVEAKNNTLDLATTFNNEYSAYDQDLNAKIGQQVNMSNGLSFIVTSVEPWTSKDEYNKPDAGKKFIRINIIVGSRAEKRLASYDIGSFLVKENDGQPRSDAHVYLSGDDDLGVPDLTRYEDGLDTGKTLKGAIVFSVNNDAKLHLVYKATPYGYPKDATDDDYSTQQMNVKAEVEL